MCPNKKYILQLMEQKNLSMGNLARKAGVSTTTISRWLRGERGAGTQLLSGLHKAFPNEPIDKLFFLD